MSFCLVFIAYDKQYHVSAVCPENNERKHEFIQQFSK